jgi:hypothetical protein
VDVGRRNYQQRELGNVREGVNLVTTPDAQDAATEEKEGNVGTQGGGNFYKTRGRNFATAEPQVAKQGCGGIAGTPTEAAAGWNLFIEIDLDTRTNIELATQGVDGSIYEVLVRGLRRKGLVSVDIEADTGGFGMAEP